MRSSWRPSRWCARSSSAWPRERQPASTSYELNDLPKRLAAISTQRHCFQKPEKLVGVALLEDPDSNASHEFEVSPVASGESEAVFEGCRSDQRVSDADLGFPSNPGSSRNGASRIVTASVAELPANSSAPVITE